MSNWKVLEKELLTDPATKKEYDRLAPRYMAISKLVALRLKKGMSQKYIAEKLGTKQSAIARLESGNFNPSLDFLQRMAQVMGSTLTIHLSN